MDRLSLTNNEELVYHVGISKYGVTIFTYNDDMDYRFNSDGFSIGNFDNGDWFLC